MQKADKRSIFPEENGFFIEFLKASRHDLKFSSNGIFFEAEYSRRGRRIVIVTDNKSILDYQGLRFCKP